MTVVVLGATGFIGRALVLALQGRGHTVHALARSPARAASSLPEGVGVSDFADDAALRAAIARADAVVNLAGEPIATRWTAARKQALVASRVDTTARLVEAIARRGRPLPVLVNASATGWYGDRGDEILDDRSSPGHGFAAALCRAWEAAARGANATRVVHPRFGIVLGRGGGALRPLLRVFGAGLGGPIAGGAQWMPWIHVEDAANALVAAVEDPRISGPVVVASPNPVRQRDFARALGHALHRPAIVPVPRFGVQLVLGEAASVVLASARVLPRILTATGFRFAFPALDGALADLVDDAATIVRATDAPHSAYLEARRPRYTLTARTELPAPLADVFDFFASPRNLAALTPPDLAFTIAGELPAMGDHVVIDYTIRIAGIPLRWRTRIERWEPGVGFVDSQERGPYRAWWHEHRFHARGATTTMEDVVHFAPPLGPLGAIANRLVVARMLRKIFGYRREAIRLRFPAGRAAELSSHAGA